jgi:K+-sensing histidine kinase KdpD
LGIAIPIAITMLASLLRLPAFVFEHLIILIVLAVAVPWGVGAAVVAAVVAVLSDNILLREPIGQPTITGVRDAIDLGLFTVVAAVVGGLVARARSERARAQDAAERERCAREDRDRLIATVSHDLANPLSVLTGTLHHARRIDSSQGSELTSLLRRLETATARATSLVRTLVDAQALETKGFVLRTALVDLRAVVAPIAEMMDRLSDRHSVVLAMPPNPTMVLADADRLQRVVENLVSNAIKYSPNGGAVEVSVRVEGGHVVVGVRDDGIGISEEALPRIFERAFRAPEALATAPGLGLGLSIAAQIVAHHGGTLSAHPAHPCGTIMLVRLPEVRIDLEQTAPAAVG